MPGPYGSLANPAELDPFQQIVGVHWGDEKYIAFPLHIQRRSVVKNYPFPYQGAGEVGQTEQPVDWTVDHEPSPTPGAGPLGLPWYVTGFQYEYAIGAEPREGYGGYGRLSTGGWTPRTIDAFEGVPSLPDARSVAPWSVMFFVGSTTSTVLSWWPRAEYQPIAGSPIEDFTVPHDSDIPFVSVSSVTLQMRGVAFTSGPNQGGEFDTSRDPYTDPVTPFNVKTGTTGPVHVSTEEGIDHVFETLTVNVSAIRISRNGKTYAAIGAALIPPAVVFPTSPGELWILCERESTTS
jgi:hypothetical protein